MKPQLDFQPDSAIEILDVFYHGVYRHDFQPRHVSIVQKNIDLEDVLEIIPDLLNSLTNLNTTLNYLAEVEKASDYWRTQYMNLSAD